MEATDHTAVDESHPVGPFSQVPAPGYPAKRTFHPSLGFVLCCRSQTQLFPNWCFRKDRMVGCKRKTSQPAPRELCTQPGSHLLGSWAAVSNPARQGSDGGLFCLSRSLSLSGCLLQSRPVRAPRSRGCVTGGPQDSAKRQEAAPGPQEGSQEDTAAAGRDTRQTGKG